MFVIFILVEHLESNYGVAIKFILSNSLSSLQLHDNVLKNNEET